MANEHMLTNDQIENRFGYHRATFPMSYDPADSEDDLLTNHVGELTKDGARNTAADHALIRQAYIELAKAVRDITGGPSREQSLAITSLQESMMWANAAVAMRSPLIRE